MTSSLRSESTGSIDKLLNGKVEEQVRVIKLLVSAENIRDSMLEEQTIS